MASIKKLSDRKFKITISNGYRPNGKKICKAKTITVPDSVKARGIPQYVAHEAEELERLVKSGFAEDRDTTFETYAARWLERQVKYAPGTLASYRRMLERVYPYIGAVKLGELRPMALENMLIELRKRTHQSRPIQEATVQKYLTVVSAVLSDAKRNEIISKNPARMIDLPDTEHRQQFIPTDEQAQELILALLDEPYHYKLCFPFPDCGGRAGCGGRPHQEWPQPLYRFVRGYHLPGARILLLPAGDCGTAGPGAEPLPVRQREGPTHPSGHFYKTLAPDL